MIDSLADLVRRVRRRHHLVCGVGVVLQSIDECHRVYYMAKGSESTNASSMTTGWSIGTSLPA